MHQERIRDFVADFFIGRKSGTRSEVQTYVKICNKPVFQKNAVPGIGRPDRLNTANRENPDQGVSHFVFRAGLKVCGRFFEKTVLCRSKRQNKYVGKKTLQVIRITNISFYTFDPESKPVHPFLFNPHRPHFPYLLMTQDLPANPVITLDTVNV